jgi:hypothetical protein
MKYSKLSNKWYLFRDQAVSAFRAVFSWRHSWVFLILNILLLSSLFLGSWKIFQDFQENILILHYNVDFGVDWIGEKKSVFLLAQIALAFFLFDFLILLIVAKKKYYRFLSFFVWGAAIISEIFLLAALFSIYLVNFR